MNIESSIVFRSVARIACLVLGSGLLSASAAMAQLPISFKSGPPHVLSGSVLPFHHGSTGVWNQVYSMKIAPNGYTVFLDSAAPAVYQLAPGASVPTGPIAVNVTNGSPCVNLNGGYDNAGIAIDSDNNLYVGSRYSSAQFCKVPYTGSSSTPWDFTKATLMANLPVQSGTSTALNPQDLFMTYTSSQGGGYNTLYFSTSGNTGGNAIYEVTVDPKSGTFVGNATPIITGLQDFAKCIAVDPAGDVFFVENIYPAAPKVAGVMEITASEIASNPNGISAGGSAGESAYVIGGSTGSGAFTGLTGVDVDAQGNVYFSSINNASYLGYVSGVYMIPNEGSAADPNLVWSDTVRIAPVYAGNPPLVDPRGFIWISTGGGGSNWSPEGTNAPACDETSSQTINATCTSSDIVIWKPGMATAAASSEGSAAPVNISAFSVTGSTLTLTTATSNSFAENQVVTISAPISTDPLYPLNGKNFYVLGSTNSPTSNAFSITTSAITGSDSIPAGDTDTAAVTPYTTVYYTFNKATTPTSFALGQNSNQLAFIPNPAAGNIPQGAPYTSIPPCTAGATYPAFSATEDTASNPYTDFSWCALYVQLNTPAAGLVDSDVQMLDASGVVTGGNAYIGGVVQGATISNLTAPTVTSVVSSGLSQPGEMASDAQGDLYVADAGEKAIQVYKAGTSTPTSLGNSNGVSLKGPTGVAVDGAGDVFIGDSGDVYEIPYSNGKLQTGSETAIINGLGSELSLAVDGMGDLFVADQSNSQVVEMVNAQSQLLRQNLPELQTLANSNSVTGFSEPSAIASDNCGDVWVAAGTNLWEIAMPFGGATEVAKNLPYGAVTGLAIDPSDSVFVASSTGLSWIPNQAICGSPANLNTNDAHLLSGGFGSTGSLQPPIGVALDGLENVYADYGASATAGLSELNINGTINLNNALNEEINPAVPYEVDAGLFNLGNTPLMLAAFSPNNGDDTVTGSSDYSILQAANFNTPACISSTGVSTGNWCYLGLELLATAANPDDTATATIASNATNAPSGLNIALSADVVTDPRPATSIALSIAPDTTDQGCAGSTYPGCQIATVTVTSASGTPQGNVTIQVPGSGLSQDNQTATLSSGVATFTFTNLSGGTYHALVTYAGEGSLNPPCSGSDCFAGSAAQTTFTIAPAAPAITVGAPGIEGCLSWTQSSSCTPAAVNVTYYLGTYFAYLGASNYLTAQVVSTLPLPPTGSVSFQVNGKPVDSTQPQSSLLSGIADFGLSNLVLGTYNITAHYSGDENYAPEDFAIPAFQVIKKSVEVTAAQSSTPPTLTTKAGTPAQATLYLMPLVGFNGEVSLQCVSASLPQYAECTFAYPNSGTGTIGVGETNTTPPYTIVVTISTNVPVNSGTTASLARRAPWALAGLFGLGLLGLIAGRKRCSRYLTMVCLAVMLSGAFMGVTSCTNAGYSTPPPPPNEKTPAGTYNVQIISFNPSTLQQNSLVNTPPYTLQLTVQ